MVERDKPEKSRGPYYGTPARSVYLLWQDGATAREGDSERLTVVTYLFSHEFSP